LKNLIQLNSKKNAIELFNQQVFARLSDYLSTNEQSEFATLFDLMNTVEKSLELDFVWLEIKNVLFSLENLDKLNMVLKQMSVILSNEKLKTFKELYEKEADRLKSEISARETEFSWSMPLAEFPKEKAIEEFLRSESVSYEYRPKTFNSIHEARVYATEHGGMRATYSTQMSGEGRGKTAYVKITKTEAYFSVKSFKTKRLIELLYFFRNILINLKD